MDSMDTIRPMEEQVTSLLDTSDCDSESDTSAPSNEDLKLDLKRSLTECYNLNIKQKSQLDLNDASALCQFLDVLNDLDEVLDKSLECLDDVSDDDDVIFKQNLHINNSNGITLSDSSSCDDVIVRGRSHNHHDSTGEFSYMSNFENGISSEESLRRSNAELFACTDLLNDPIAINSLLEFEPNKKESKIYSQELLNAQEAQNDFNERENTNTLLLASNPPRNNAQFEKEPSTSHQTNIPCVKPNCRNESHREDSETNLTMLKSDLTSQEGNITNSCKDNRPKPRRLVRAKSLSNLCETRDVENVDHGSDELRSSMRRLDPIALPALTQNECEPLTLPVILFLEHRVNMRPNSAPIQVQLTAANLSDSTGPLIVGRRTLLMNSTLVPSPEGSERAAGNWEDGTIRSSSSSSSSESLTALPQAAPAHEDRNGSESQESPSDVWPHRMSATLACLSCTIGVFNISRFSIFSVHFGASFLIQFTVLSLLIGIPLMTLYLCLGQVLAAGPVDMWRISPVFQGVGLSLLIAQAAIGVYSFVGVSWLLVYLRDSFITSADRYRWSVPWDQYDELSQKNTTSAYKIEETVAQYFHYEVLQRSPNASANGYGSVKFQVAFNLAVVWMLVFVALSKGLRSYGKAVYLLIFLPVAGTLTLCTKLLTLMPHRTVANLFADTEWSEFFINNNSWSAAAQETFLTWGLLGPCVMQLTSHKRDVHKSRRLLQRESACIVAFTVAILVLAAFLANACVLILRDRGYLFLPGSYESVASSQFVYSVSAPLPGVLGSTPARFMAQYGGLVGVTTWRAPHQLTGWQPLQLPTQLVPATLALISPLELSPAWAVIFYGTLVVLGVAQQAALWQCVVAGTLALDRRALAPWATAVTFLSCVGALLAGLALTTHLGIRIIHWLDYVLVGAWAQCAVQVALMVGVFVVRGRPYAGDTVVRALFHKGPVSLTIGALLSFTWNVVLPIVLIALAVIDFRTGKQKFLYSWRRSTGYWPVWARQLAVAVQQLLLLIIPVTAFVQLWRYMSKGPTDILDRVQNLYRPRLSSQSDRPVNRGGASAGVAPVETRPSLSDPPPKYTPPPSYSTATGARLLNTLRRSFRTLRRMTSPISERNEIDITQTPMTLSENVDSGRYTSLEHPPPDYTGICSAPSISVQAAPSVFVTDEVSGDRQNPDKRNRQKRCQNRDLSRQAASVPSFSNRELASNDSIRRNSANESCSITTRYTFAAGNSSMDFRVDESNDYASDNTRRGNPVYSTEENKSYRSEANPIFGIQRSRGSDVSTSSGLFFSARNSDATDCISITSNAAKDSKSYSNADSSNFQNRTQFSMPTNVTNVSLVHKPGGSNSKNGSNKSKLGTFVDARNNGAFVDPKGIGRNTNLTRNFLRRSYAGRDSARNMRSSLRRSFKHRNVMDNSLDNLVRNAEPISNTLAMSAMLENENLTN